MPDILVVKPSSFGDIVHGLQVAETIRRRVRDVRMAWVAAEAFAPFVRACTTVDEVFEFARHGGVGAFLRLVRTLRRRRFDVVLDMQGLARSGLITRLARGDRRIGRADAREGAGWFCGEHIALPRDGRRAHALDILLQFLPAFGAAPELAGRLEFSGATLPLPWPPEAGDGPLVVMFPDSRRAEKNWPGFGALTDQLLSRHRTVRIVWAGQEARTLQPSAAGNGRFLNWAGRTRIEELPALLRAADWVVANDSGPTHLAAALGVRVLAIFGPTDPRRFGPYPVGHPRHRVVQAGPEGLARLPVDAVAHVLEEAGLAAGEGEQSGRR